MNREIKFRAWDQQAHDWNNKYSINAGGEHTPLREMYDWLALKEYSMDVLDGDNQFNIMQFTGLKDKNGVDIYEGDIITFSTRRYHFGTDKGLQTIKFKSVVTWDEGGFMVSENQELDTFLCAHNGCSDNPNGYEVIGNI